MSQWPLAVGNNKGMRGAGKAEEQGRQQHGRAGRRHHEWDGSVVESIGSALV
jgi:hypothetical protein